MKKSSLLLLLSCIVCLCALGQGFHYEPIYGDFPYRQNNLTNGSHTTQVGYPKFCIRDLALIYQGGVHRPDWTEEQLVPYVCHTFADGGTEWTFDGFLFIEFWDGKGNYFIERRNATYANKEIWLWYLNRVFEKGKSLSALDNCITNLKKRLAPPGFKHKIVLTIPTPLPGTNWGKIDGKILDFKKTSDQLAATKWYINQLVERFKDAKYKNIELVGLYWVNEDMNLMGNVINSVANYVHDKGLYFVWIPYYNTKTSKDYKKYGFDIAYLQPNYFMYEKEPASRVRDACIRAREQGLGLEFECDERALAGRDNFITKGINRMNIYINTFESMGVYQTSPLAYYMGARYILDSYNNKNIHNQQVNDIIAKKIVERRKSNPLMP